MKLALVIALAPDRRSGRVMTEVLASDKAIAFVKNALASGECPDARYPILRAISIDSHFREHRFRVSAQDVTDAEDTASMLPSDAPKMIPVELGSGDEKTIINVQTDAEAKFILELATSASGAAGRIAELEAQLAATKKTK
jgi:hypothetical protein